MTTWSLRSRWHAGITRICIPTIRRAGSSGGRTSTRRTRRGYFGREGKIRKTKNRVDRGQTGLTANFRKSQPEIHVRLVSPRGVGRRKRLPHHCRDVAHCEQAMKTYNFRIVVEPDGERWHAYCPALVGQGGATWGHTQQEALKNIQEVVQMVAERSEEHTSELQSRQY